MVDRAPSQRRRLPRVRTVVAVLLLAWLVGRGLGWLGSGGDAVDPAARAESERSTAAAASQPAPSPAAADAEQATGGRQAVAAAAPLGEVGAAPPPEVPAPRPEPQPAPAFDADRFASMLSLVTHATAQRQFGGALASLQHLRSLPLDGAQQAALLAPAAELQSALSAACGDLARLLLQGQVLAAHRELATLLADDGPGLADCVRQGLQLAGFDVAPGRDRLRGDVPLPIARPLPRGRAVRCLRDGVLQEARVVDSRSDAVTLRLPNARGVTFPTVAVVQCEPVAATADEAMEMAFAALQGDDVLLARLWAAVARRSGLRGEGRAERLATLLP